MEEIKGLSLLMKWMICLRRRCLGTFQWLNIERIRSFRSFVIFCSNEPLKNENRSNNRISLDSVDKKNKSNRLIKKGLSRLRNRTPTLQPDFREILFQLKSKNLLKRWSLSTKTQRKMIGGRAQALPLTPKGSNHPNHKQRRNLLHKKQNTQSFQEEAKNQKKRRK